MFGYGKGPTHFNAHNWVCLLGHGFNCFLKNQNKQNANEKMIVWLLGL
jgi:hypothetical protein